MNYLLITSSSIGGSEVRLVKCWLMIKKSGLTASLKLVLNNSLLDLLLTRQEFLSLKDYETDIIASEFSQSFLENTRQLSAFLNLHLQEGDTAHVLLQYPIYLKKKNIRIVYTHPATTIFGFTNLKGILGQFYFVFKAQVIDVLDPFVFSFFRTVFFYKRKSIHLTQYGVDESLFRLSEQVDYTTKENTFVFLGRFVAGKQILELLNTLEFVHTYLKERGISDHKFLLIGQGPLLPEVEQVCLKLKEKQVPIALYTAVSNPYAFLLKAKGFFSIQKVNNYPSQALFEGLMAGCLPVVTDCGNTRLIAKPEFSFFIPEHFTKEQMAKEVYETLNLDQAEFEKKSTQAIAHVKTTYYSMKMALYYSSLYKS